MSCPYGRGMAGRWGVAGTWAGAAGPYAGGVRATWWYTVAGLVFLDLVVLMNWWLWLGELPEHVVLPGGAALAALGAVLQLAAATVLVRDYPVGVPGTTEDEGGGPDRGPRGRRAVALVV